jgi:hypothetical protein
MLDIDTLPCKLHIDTLLHNVRYMLLLCVLDIDTLLMYVRYSLTMHVRYRYLLPCMLDIDCYYAC